MPQGFVLWFTGLSGAGKSTLAGHLVAEFAGRGQRLEVLDGDEVRTHLSKGLGFSKEDRDTNIRRIGFVARLLARNGVPVLTAAISPYREVRDEVRAWVEGDGAAFIEVFVDCTIEELTRRDVKGLYEKALRGEIANFTGVSDPYEPPLTPEITVRSDSQTESESLSVILAHLEQRGLLPAGVAMAAD
jgi:adenylyl-sulfate kinase